MKKRSLIFLLLIILISSSIMFTSCSSKSSSNSSAPPETQVEVAPKSSQLSTPAQPSNRKLIVKLSMEMRVDDVEKSIQTTEAMAASVGGYIRESNQNELSGQITIMVPVGNIDTFTSSLKGLGKIMNSNRTTEDVTDSYFDTQVRIKNLEAEIETMRNLIQKPGWKVSEILEIEREIRRLTDELESLKGYITNLERQITYSEVHINFEKSQIAIDSSSQDSLGYKLKLALNNGLVLLVNIATVILSLIAFILPISPFAIIGYFILRKPIRRLNDKSKQDPKQ